jgi:hypothetical protein
MKKQFFPRQERIIDERNLMMQNLDYFQNRKECQRYLLRTKF